MPAKFATANSIDQVYEILNAELSISVSANSESCVNFPEMKGIYFWFITPEGLEVILQKLQIPCINLLPNFSFEGHRLIYIGTAGIRRTANNTGHIKQRLEWHILARHRASSILSGTLSTFRTTLGSILCDDLISSEGIETEGIVNTFMANHLKVGFITYTGHPNDVVNSVDWDEVFLIKSITPLLNLKNNSNKSIVGHPTYIVSRRRKEINGLTKERL